MPSLSGRRTLGSTVRRRPIAESSFGQSNEVICGPPPRFIEGTRHVTSTVHDPVELFRDILEEQFQRHTGQLAVADDPVGKISRLWQIPLRFGTGDR